MPECVSGLMVADASVGLFVVVNREHLPVRQRFSWCHDYAHLNKVLEVMEGHLIRGYGAQQKPDAEIELLPGAVEEANRFLEGKPESLERLERVRKLIEGFETPYGMELLATVHWVAQRGGPQSEGVRAMGPSEAVEQIHAWNPRKKTVFQPEHIRVAWGQLAELGWMGGGERAGLKADSTTNG